MTLKQIAKMASVTESTVSKALSGSREVSPSLAAEIRKIAIETGYFREKSLRKLEYRGGEGASVAIICPEFISISYLDTVNRLCRAVEKQGGSVALFSFDFDREKFARIVERITLSGGFDAIISISGYAIDTVFPVLYIGSSCYEGGDNLHFDFETVFDTILEQLCSVGHRRFGFVGERFTGEKYAAYRNALRRRNLAHEEKFDYIIEERFENIGFAAAERILAQNERPEALIAAYDEVALSAIFVLEQNGISVPDDISVVGINDIPFAAYSSIPLSTVAIGSNGQFERAVERLFAKIGNNSLPSTTETVEIVYKSRHSVAPRKDVV